MIRLRGKTLREKITMLVATPILIAMFIFGLIFFIHTWLANQKALRMELELRAKMIAENCPAAVDFADVPDAVRVLTSLSRDSRIYSAAILVEGDVFVAWPDASVVDSFPTIGTERRSWFEGGKLHVQEPGLSARPSTVYVSLDTASIYREVALGGLLYLFSVILTCLLATFLVQRMRRQISEPFSSLTETMQAVSEDNDYHARATVFEPEDEIGKLALRFNNMIELVGKRDQELAANIKRLEQAGQKVRDAQEREARIRERLERAERLESIGMLAGGVAHDLNNLLGPVLGYPAMIRDTHQDDPELCQDMDEIEQAAAQASALIKDLLTLARRGQIKQVPIHTGDSIKAFIDSANMRRMLQRCDELELEVDFPEDLPAVMGSQASLTQLITNVATNGLNAMDNCGCLKITASEVKLEQDYRGYEMVPAGSYIRLAISDEGKGISKEVQQKIFEPFFSTKKMGGNRGSGLGLSIVYSAIKDMNGFIDIDSVLQKGTTFSFYLPTINAIPGIANRAPKENLRGTEQILVVDDLREQRQLMVRLLSSLGYEVHTCASAEEGIAWLGENPCDILLLDMMLGEGLNGCEATKVILQDHPSLPILLVSGFAPGNLIETALNAGARGFVSKPYTPQELGTEVRRILQFPELSVPLENP